MILILGFSAAFYDAFDGANKPLWVNLLLIGAASSYIVVRFAGWLVLRNPVKGNNLIVSLRVFQINLQRIAVAVLLTSLLFGTALILFFSTSIRFTPEKYFLLAGLSLVFLLVVYLASRIWFKRASGINATLADFNNDSDE